MVPAYTPNPGRGTTGSLLDMWYEGRDKQRIVVRPPALARRLSGGPGAVRGVRGRADGVRGRVHREHGGREPRERGHGGDRPDRRLVGDGARRRGRGRWRCGGRRSGRRGGTTGGWRTSRRWAAESPYLSGNADNLLLVGKPGGAYNAITVGSYARHDPGHAVPDDLDGRERDRARRHDGGRRRTSRTSRLPGKTRDGRMKPELTAPGERVLGAVSKDAYPGLAPNSIYRYHPFPEVDALITENTPDHAFGAAAGDVVLGAGGERARGADPVDEPDPGRDPGAEHAASTPPLADGFTGRGAERALGLREGRARTVGGAPLPSDLRITVDALPGGVKDKPYNLVLTASGGTLPYTWSRIAGCAAPGSGPGEPGAPHRRADERRHLRGHAAGDGRVARRDGQPGVLARGRRAAGARRADELVARGAGRQALRGRRWKPRAGRSRTRGRSRGGACPTGISLLANGALDGTPVGTLGPADFTVRVQDLSAPPRSRSLRLKVVGEAGDEWDPLGKSTPTVNQIAIDPGDSSRVFVSTRNIDAVFESTNGGDSWRATSINNNLNSFASYLRVSPFVHGVGGRGSRDLPLRPRGGPLGPEELLRFGHRLRRRGSGLPRRGRPLERRRRDLDEPGLGLRRAAP